MPISAVTLPLFNASQIRQLDAQAINVLGITAAQLMKRAGRAAFECLRDRWPDCKSVVVLCGSGNNAGDGFVVAALAAQRGLQVRVYTLVEPSTLRLGLSEAAGAAYDYAVQEGVSLSQLIDLSPLTEHCVVIDALVGIGLQGSLKPQYIDAIEKVNQLANPVLALDVPSGLCVDTGTIGSKAIKADVTVTFVARKQGLVTATALEYVGQLIFADLAIPNAVLESEPASALELHVNDYTATFPARPANAHKGLYGHLMVVGGDIGMGGACILAAQAALNTGAGKVSLSTQESHVVAALSRAPEIMAAGVVSGQELEPRLESADIIVVGPGLGKSYWSEQMLQRAVATKKPMVLDADGLNILAEGRLLASERRNNWVLTPHPGEAGRLLSCSTTDVQADRFTAARRIQQQRGGVVVLKGAGTIIASENQLIVMNAGNAGMAVAGMGDILSGIVGALMAIGHSPLDAAIIGVGLHGAAGDLAVQDAGQWGLRASDLLPKLSPLINGIGNL